MSIFKTPGIIHLPLLSYFLPFGLLLVGENENVGEDQIVHYS